MAKKYLDKTGLALVWEKIKNGLSGKVDKVDGKGLSSNDYTSTEKTKLANVASGAQVNVLEGIQKNGDTVQIVNKIANISVPTKTSDITNDSGFITASDVNTAIATAVAGITSFEYEVVQSLPAEGEAGVIYLVAHSHGTGDSYDEYIWVSNAFEKIGNTDIDLSGYVLSADLVAITNTEINQICV